jgi:hypothetical protein
VGIISSLNSGWSMNGRGAGRLEEVERVARGRGVDDHDVEAVVVVQRVQPLGGHVLLRATERARDVAIEAVGQDPFGLLGVGSVRAHEPVEGGWPCRASSPTARPSRRAGTSRRVGVVELSPPVQPERVGEALGRIDGDHDGASTE